MATVDAESPTLGSKRAHAETLRSVDLWAVILWSISALIAAMALPAANWTDDLGLVPLIAAFGLLLGALLARSRFGGITAAIVALGYGVVVILWEMTSVLDPGMAWRDRVFDFAGRIGAFFSLVFAGEPSEDTLMFVLMMSIVFWVAAVFGTWWLLRRDAVWVALLLPGVAVFLNVYYYRYGERLQIYLPLFLLAALGLIVRNELAGRRRVWEKARAQVPSDIAARTTQAGVVAALMMIGIAWLWPQEREVDPAAGVATGSVSYSPLGEVLSDALAGLRSPVNLYGETFADTLSLGAGIDPGEKAILQAGVRGEIPQGVRPYWRARVFDTFQDGGWTTTIGNDATFRPRSERVFERADKARAEVEFLISPFVPALKLLYLPARVEWISRTSSLRQIEAEGEIVDVLEATSVETVLPGESYRVRSSLAVPTATQLRAAGTEYPDWIAETYLQVPADLPNSVTRLAARIVGQAPNPYAKADAITTWLRKNIEYQRVMDAPPAGADPVEWFLFEAKSGFCDYYASAAVLMLRSVGVPARFAVGYAPGEYDPEANQYFVSSTDTHSWPEVYFPDYGWVEFEPTVSQTAIIRPEGEGDPGVAEPDPANSPDDLGPTGGSPSDDILRGLPEDVEIPAPPVNPFRWIPLVLAGFFGAAALILLTPARTAVARAAVLGTRRAGMGTPRWVEEWAAPPKTESARAFRRLAKWAARLGATSGTAISTPHERAAALADMLPEQESLISEIAEAYAMERYGGRLADPGVPTRAWRSLRGHLVRARLSRLFAGIFGE